MRIAVMSGKGGTGKTTISTNLALSMHLNYMDCDVEEPNGFLFLRPEISESRKVLTGFPDIDKDLCTVCGECEKICQFHALGNTGKQIFVFEKLCHDCGACKLVCKNNALKYSSRATGVIEKGMVHDLICVQGVMNISEPMSVPIIKEMLKGTEEQDYLLDCPPGTSCNVVQILRNADAVIMVTEPTKFGLHDLKMAVELVEQYKIPFGIIINKEFEKDNLITEYCKKEKMILFGSLPFKELAAQIYSRGDLLIENDFYEHLFQEIGRKIKEVFLWN